jgi:hypothetical protein
VSVAACCGVNMVRVNCAVLIFTGHAFARMFARKWDPDFRRRKP